MRVACMLGGDCNRGAYALLDVAFGELAEGHLLDVDLELDEGVLHHLNVEHDRDQLLHARVERGTWNAE